MERKIIAVIMMLMAVVGMSILRDTDALAWAVGMVPVGAMAFMSIIVAPKEWKDKVRQIVEP